MHTLSEKPKATQQATPAKSTILGRVHLGHSPEVRSILHLQRTIENRAVLRPPQAQSDGLEAVSNATASGRCLVIRDRIYRSGSSYCRIKRHKDKMDSNHNLLVLWHNRLLDLGTSVKY